MTESPDLLAGRYRLLEECGAGGMSVVWHGFDEVLQRDVAVKLLKSEFAEDDELRTAIHREARAAARLHHPYIASVYDYGETDQGLSFVVMELVTGVPFAVRLHDGAVPWAEAVSVCGQVAQAMAEAHAQGVVHRDIKPGNLMVTGDGVKVVDFGISAVIGEADGGQLLGTPAYMAPERITGGRVDCATDVYALGLVLYRALAGELPWPSATAGEVLLAHAAGADRNLRQPPGVPDEIMAACRACLARDPAQRPTMAELARILTPDAPLDAPLDAPAAAPTPTAALTLPMTVPYVPPRANRRHLVYAGVAAVLLLGGMTTAMTRLTGGQVPDPGASFGEAAIPGAPAQQLLVTVRAENSGPGDDKAADAVGSQGNGNGNATANGHGNGNNGNGVGNRRRG